MGKFIDRLKEAFYGAPEQQAQAKEQDTKRTAESERQRIEVEVLRKKQRASVLGVDKVVGSLWNDIQYYPSWFKQGAVCSLVTDVKELEKEQRDDKEWRRIQLTLKGKDYICAFEEHDCYTPDSTEQHGTLELYSNNKKILALSMAYDYDQYYSEWKPFSVEGFIEGDWIKDFKEFRERSEKESKERLDALLRKPVDKLKKDFDIQ